MSEENDAIAVRTDAMLRELAQVQDIPLQVAIEVGRLRLKVRDLLKLAPNSIIQLKKPVGEPFDICLGHDVHVFTTNVDGDKTSDVPLGVAVPLHNVKVHYFASSFRRAALLGIRGRF